MKIDYNGTNDVIVDSLTDAQLQAVTSDSSRLCIIASAGSGKTKVIVKRIEHLCKNTSLSPNQIVAITFTRKAGFELANRLSKTFGDVERERPYVGTLHSFVMNELSNFHNENRSRLRQILENPIQLLNELSIQNPHQILRAISWCKTRLIDPTTISEEVLATLRKNTHIAPRSLDRDTLIQASRKYINACTSRAVMDHDDALHEYCFRLNDPSYLASRHYLYRHIFVDEFQDSTPLHMEIYKRLCSSNTSLSVVGDPDQSIFSFTGANPEYLNRFSQYFPGAQTIFLSTNFRSTKANVQVARSVLISSAHEEVQSVRYSNLLPKLHTFSDEQSEASGVMSIVSSSHARGIALSSIAILVRTNAQKQQFINAANALGISVNVGREKIEDPVVAKIINTIKNLKNKRHWKSIYDALDDISRLYDNEVSLSNSDDQKDKENETRKEILSQLRKSARSYMELFPNDHLSDVEGFFEYIQSQLTPNITHSKGVSILTFHQSKGLEFNTVVVSGCEKGLVPLYRDKVRKAEEARLLYVAMSRATDELHITRAKVRIRNGNIKVQEASEFLNTIKENIADIDVRNDLLGTSDAIKRIADIRTKYLRKKLII